MEVNSVHFDTSSWHAFRKNSFHLDQLQVLGPGGEEYR
jgi:hypothetical protein